MLRSKKGLSGIVVAIIMIALVLVAAGILWAIIGNLLTRQSKSLTAADLCTGIIIDIEKVEWEGNDNGIVNVTLRRSRLSTGNEINKVELTLDDGTGNLNPDGDGNIASSKFIQVTSIASSFNPTEVILRWYVKPEDTDQPIACQSYLTKKITGSRPAAPAPAP